MDEDKIALKKAKILFERAYRHQRHGELGQAIALYKQSLATCPTAEAHTFLGWSYSMLNRYDEAIAQCHLAIALDPDFGNPYNDIGAYLIELQRWDEAIPWLEKAVRAARYENPQFPYLNLGRVYQKLGDYPLALSLYNQALVIDPLYLRATWARTALLGKMN